MTLPQPRNFPSSTTSTIHTLIQALDYLSQNRVGALLIIEHQIYLTEQNILRPGIPVKMDLNLANLLRIFQPNSPLHDGAIQIQGTTIIAAGILLPLSHQFLPRRYGTRHLAALGISEQVETCIGLVVSEETGSISLTYQGRFYHSLTLSELQIKLQQLFYF